MGNWLIPGDETNLEVTFGSEQVAVYLTAWLAKIEPAALVQAALDYALLEDFDHLYRYANMYELTEGKQAEEVIGTDLTEVIPGRPTISEHQHPFDTIRNHWDGKTADPLTKLHTLTIVAAEQQTMNLYMNIGNRPVDMDGRALYLEIAQIEEQHVSHYESLADPNETWWEMAVMHEYNECYLYYSCMESETDERIKKMWEWHLDAEIGHLQDACTMMREQQGRDPEEMLPPEMPEELVIFQSNTEYVRKVLAEQLDWTTEGPDIVKDRKPERYEKFQEKINAGDVPSQKMISKHIDKMGEDYRLEIDGEHPVERLRPRDKVVK